MKHVFKLGGERKSLCGESYTIKCVNDTAEYLADGWYNSLDEAIAAKPKKAPKKATKKA